MLCPVCNHELDGSPRFCNKCGAKLELSPVTADAPKTEVAADAFIGQTVGGRFRIVKLLGEGGMGAVYLGEQNVGGTVRKVAIKTLHQHLSNDPKIKQRFERECATVAELQHPNTIQLYDFGTTDDGILYMVMEFVQGESLASILEKKGALEPGRTQHILQQICDALGEAHALGIVHRDLKPDNIVLTERAKDWVKVLDFGIAKRSEAPDKQEQKLTQQGTVLGTPPYMSPEQFTGKPIDARSDIYSIGMIVYEMLSGRLPFSANTPWEWATQHMTVAPKPLSVTPTGAPVPPAMAEAVMKSLAKDADQRFATTKEFYDAFSAGGSQAVSAPIAVQPASYLLTPAFAPASGPVDQKGKTQIGEPAYTPAPFGGPQGTGTSPGAFAAGAHYGTPAAGNVAFPVTAAIPPGPPPPQAQSSGGGKGVLIALLALLGLMSAGAVGIALTRHPTVSVAGGGAGSVESPIPVATHADLSATAVPVDTAPLDTTIAPLNSASAAPPKKGADAGGPSVAPPTNTLTPVAPTPTTPPTPTAPVNDPPSCQKARTLKAKNPQAYGKKVQLERLEEQCTRAGGQL